MNRTWGVLVLILLGVLIGIDWKIGILISLLSWIFMFKKTKLLLLTVMISFVFEKEKTMILGSSFNYTYIFMMVFIFYYLICEIDYFRELITNKTFISFFSLFLLIAVVSQFQSFKIDFPITSIRPGAILNYPFIKGLTRIVETCALIIFSLCVAHYSNKTNLEKLIKWQIGIETLIILFLLFSLSSDFLFGYDAMREYTTAHSTELAVRMRGFFDEPSILALYLITTIPLTLSLLMNNKNNLLIIAFILQLVSIILTFSRSGWIATLFIVLIMGYFSYKNVFIKNKRKILFLSVFILIVLTTTYLNSVSFKKVVDKSLFEPFSEAANPYTGRFWSTKLRLEAYSAAMSAFQKHPILGVGFFNFHFYGGAKNYLALLPDLPALNYPETNNILLTILSETGLIGLITITYMIFVHGRYILRISRTLEGKNKNMLIGFFSTTVGILISYMFISKFTYNFLWFFLGLYIAFVNSQERESVKSI